LEDAEVHKGKIFRKGPGARALMNDGPAGLERYLATLAISRGLLSDDVSKEVLKQIP
jgi:hypothetical protein